MRKSMTTEKEVEGLKKIKDLRKKTANQLNQKDINNLVIFMAEKMNIIKRS